MNCFGKSKIPPVPSASSSSDFLPWGCVIHSTSGGEGGGYRIRVGC